MTKEVSSTRTLDTYGGYPKSRIEDCNNLRAGSESSYTCKDSYRQLARMNEATFLRKNWSSTIYDANESQLINSTEYVRALRCPQERVEMPPEVSVEEIVDFFNSSGTEEAVERILQAFEGKADVRVFAEAIAEAVQASGRSRSALHHVRPCPRESFIRRAQRLDLHEKTDAALDLIYDSVDRMLRDGQFDEVDLCLTNTSAEDLSADILLGLLTATLPARSRLPSRAKFFSDVEVSLRGRRVMEDGLLTGLE